MGRARLGRFQAVFFFFSVRLAWHVISSGRPFVPGWHLDAIADHLTAVSRGEITTYCEHAQTRRQEQPDKRLVSSTWLLLNKLAIRLLCGSYAMNLATRDNLKSRRLIKSPLVSPGMEPCSRFYP